MRNISGILVWGLSCTLGAFYTAIVPIAHFLDSRNAGMSPMIQILVPLVIAVCFLLLRRVFEIVSSIIFLTSSSTDTSTHIGWASPPRPVIDEAT